VNEIDEDAAAVNGAPDEDDEVVGEVKRVRGMEDGTGYAVWAGDVRGRHFQLSRRLLQYVGKRVRIKIEVVEDEPAEPAGDEDEPA
jgi:hypothetical protein